MECVRSTLPASTIQKFMVLPSSMQGKRLEVIVLFPDDSDGSIAKNLRGSAAKKMALNEARERRLAKYETTT